jgi:CxxC motif-containing protein (DUF1111 family)
MVVLFILLLTLAGPAYGQLDPGPRAGGAAAGGPLTGLSPGELALFSEGSLTFAEVSEVAAGLGPRFNGNSCLSCHVQPVAGGTSPRQNPLFDAATEGGANNLIPLGLIDPNGPAHVVRLARRPDRTADGSVHPLFVVSGRADAPGCVIAQPDFAAEAARNRDAPGYLYNVRYRIPTPLFGLGLVEAVPDGVLVADQAANAKLMAEYGIRSKFNRDSKDNAILRFGWKAQHKTVMAFVGEAYNTEMGITNRLSPNELDSTPGCQFNATPEDKPDANGRTDTDRITDFIRMLAAPTVAVATPQTDRGKSVFTRIGCGLCHIPQHTTGTSPLTGQSNLTFSPFSDFALHDMGDPLQDGIAQGQATGREYRTAPLWGLGQRLFFMHDGRAFDLYQAIIAHVGFRSEANRVIRNFYSLSDADKADLLRFLRSL